jgi:hypothetical protein
LGAGRYGRGQPQQAGKSFHFKVPKLCGGPSAGQEFECYKIMRRSGFDCGIGIDGAKSDPGGTGILPVKSGILPDFARAGSVRTFGAHPAQRAPHVSGRMPETTGWKPVPPVKIISPTCHGHFISGTKSIPHFGHLPGSSEITSGCMGQ